MSGSVGPTLPPAFFLEAVEALRDGVVIARLDGRQAPMVYANAAFEQLTGYTRDEMLGHDCRLLQGEDRHQPATALVRAAVDAREPCVVVVRNYRRDGSPFWNELSLTPLPDADGVVRHYVGIQKDVSERMDLQAALEERNAELERITQRLQQIAITDGLTGLYNRRFLDTHLRLSTKACARDGVPVALFMIDVDHFKDYNDAHGHVAGDAALRHVGAAIQRTFARGDDVGARYGGEEFAVVCRGIDDGTANAMATRLHAAIADRAREPEPLPGAVTVSIGFALATGAQRPSARDLVTAADANLYAAKAAGRDCTVGGHLG